MIRRHSSGVSAVAVVVLIAVIVGIAFLVMQSGVGPDGLTSHVDDYIAMLDNRTAAAPGAKAAGRAVIVDSEMKRIDELHSRLPGALRAEKHSEVDTVVVLVRTSTGIGAGTATGLGVATMQQGMVSIAAFVFDKNGTAIASHSVTEKTAMSGAGAEAEAKAKVDRDMLAWIESQF